jgi:transposase InsO family protein
MVQTQFEKKIKVLRSDNGTKYTNRAMQNFLRDNDIVHQTTCVNTPERNGVAEKKNRHIFEVIMSSFCHECFKVSVGRSNTDCHMSNQQNVIEGGGLQYTD